MSFLKRRLTDFRASLCFKDFLAAFVVGILILYVRTLSVVYIFKGIIITHEALFGDKTQSAKCKAQNHNAKFKTFYFLK